MGATRPVTAYFDAEAETWEQHYGSNGSMRFRLSRFREELRQHLGPGGTVLDFGCGPGDLSFHLAQNGYRVHGVDRSPRMIERARSRFPLPDLRFTDLDQDGFHLPFPTGHFAACVSSSVLEYLQPLDRHLAQLRRVVRKDGLLIASVPNPLHPLRILESAEKLFWRIAPGAARLWPQGRGAYLAISANRFSLRRWRNQFEAQGWRVDSVRGYCHPLLMICARAIQTGPPR